MTSLFDAAIFGTQAIFGTHMTGGIAGRVLLTFILLVAGLSIVLAGRIVVRKGPRCAIVLFGVSVLAASGLSGANANMRRHIHVCHEHGMDSCAEGHRGTGGVDHEHLFGRW